jgi:hypothetical protein
MTSAPKHYPVHTLLGESTLNVSLTCLPTLIENSTDPIRLVVHEDGSLTEPSRDALRTAIPGVEFIGRPRADDEVADRLKGYARCQAARACNVLFLKVFDVSLLEHDEICYSDSDILFLRPFTGLFGPQCARFPAMFMTDTKEAYAIRPWQLRPFGRIRLASRVNTGLMRINPQTLDLDFVEWLLGQVGGHSVWARRSYWNEQTCWAALAGRTGCGLWDYRQVAMATPAVAVDAPDAVAIHFASTYRGFLSEFSGRKSRLADPPVTVGCRAARCIGPLDQFLSDVRSRFSQ